MAKARKKTTRKKSTKKKTQTSWVHTNLFRLCFLICMICMSFIALFKFGVVGAFLNHFFSFLFGVLTDLLFVFVIGICGVKTLNKDKMAIRKRYA